MYVWAQGKKRGRKRKAEKERKTERQEETDALSLSKKLEKQV